MHHDGVTLPWSLKHACPWLTHEHHQQARILNRAPTIFCGRQHNLGRMPADRDRTDWRKLKSLGLSWGHDRWGTRRVPMNRRIKPSNKQYSCFRPPRCHSFGSTSCQTSTIPWSMTHRPWKQKAMESRRIVSTDDSLAEDIFYLHAIIGKRAAFLASELGWGQITERNSTAAILKCTTNSVCALKRTK